MGRFFTPAWLIRHAVALLVTAAFLGLGWWQWNRAHEGNAISWGYMFQWPLFALFVVALWVREVRTQTSTNGGAQTSDEEPVSSPFAAVTPAAASGDDATDAYNRYLSWLAEDPHRRPADFPG